MPDRTVKDKYVPRPVKNFERWLYQRDADNAKTVPLEKVNVTPQMFKFHKEHLYDLTARRTDVAQGQTKMQFGVDDAFLSGGPHRVAVKVTYLDRDQAEWELACFNRPASQAARTVQCGDTGKVRTATFVLNNAYFPEKGYTGCDLQIRARKKDAVIRLVRLIKLDPRVSTN